MEFPEHFFEEEKREGFTVPSMMKRAWAAQMEVLVIIADICKKHNIPFFADSGTLLGAVRHKGFIPWDDDIDTCMLRSDYQKLLQILPNELPHGFVIAGMYAESERLQNAAYVPHLRVIADETLWDFNDYMKYFHGFPYQRVGIDIFPLDTIPDNPQTAAMHYELVRHGIAIMREWEHLKASGELQGYLDGYGQACNIKIPTQGNIRNFMWRLIDRVCCLFENQDFPECTCFAYASPKYRMKRAWYKATIELPFEHVSFPAPKEYDAILTAVYGDYMTPVRGTAAHDYPFYGDMEEELKKQIAAVGFTGSVDEFCDKMANGELHV